MAKKKKLPFNEPLISYEPLTSHITGIIASDFVSYQGAFYNNFIEIKYDNAVDFKNVKYLESYNMFVHYKYPHSICEMHKNTKLIEMIKGWIDENFYVIVSFETYFVKNYPTYNSKRMRHRAMILGYDEENATFVCGDFFDFRYYTVESCNQEQVINAIIHNNEISLGGSAKDFLLIRVQKNAKPEVDINRIIVSLSTLDVCNNIDYKRQYGLEVFDRIIWMLNNKTIQERFNEYRRMPQFILEHMKVMKQRIIFFEDKNNKEQMDDLIKRIDVLIHQMTKYRNYIMKTCMENIMIVPNVDKIKCIKLLKEVKRNYIIIVQDLIICLRQKC